MTKTTPRFTLASVAVLSSLALVACGGDDDDTASTTAAPATTAAPSTVPASTAAATTTPATTAPATTAAPSTSPASTAPDTSAPGTAAPATSAPDSAPGDAIVVAPDPAIDPWTRDASEFRGNVGQQYTYSCPPGGDVFAAPIWGAELYTDDSAVCIAAVHVGLITPEEGGDVTIAIVDAQDEYAAGTANGVTSSRYGAWGGSFRFPAVPEGSVAFEVSLESWGYTVYTLDLDEGETGSIACAPNGEFRAVWGSGPYTGDSSICTAAVHAGLITHEEGGSVTILAGGTVEEYTGSESNGVTSSDYGAYGPSFVFVETER